MGSIRPSCRLLKLFFTVLLFLGFFWAISIGVSETRSNTTIASPRQILKSKGKLMREREKVVGVLNMSKRKVPRGPDPIHNSLICQYLYKIKKMREMGDTMRTIEVSKLVELSDDLINFLRNDQKDANLLAQNLHESTLHLSQSQSEFNLDRNLFQEYQEKVVLSKRKIEEAKFEEAASGELDFLQKELEEERQKEHSLREELRVVTEEINDLENQSDYVKERRQTVKKIKQDELKAEMMLRMYGSVTGIVPSLDEDSKISGCMVESKENEALEYFEYDLSESTPFDTCNSIWKRICSR